ncbi:hypothetical protein ACFP81_03695 [Deinococcus lacus]|uniref:Uncharacterized protein n=1 Tax=Deinococcus lacus TaxID=392561 RepID=A0ABW1YCJ2_9DEIO
MTSTDLWQLNPEPWHNRARTAQARPAVWAAARSAAGVAQVVSQAAQQACGCAQSEPEQRSARWPPARK